MRTPRRSSGRRKPKTSGLFDRKRRKRSGRGGYCGGICGVRSWFLAWALLLCAGFMLIVKTAFLQTSSATNVKDRTTRQRYNDQRIRQGRRRDPNLGAFQPPDRHIWDMARSGSGRHQPASATGYSTSGGGEADFKFSPRAPPNTIGKAPNDGSEETGMSEDGRNYGGNIRPAGILDTFPVGSGAGDDPLDVDERSGSRGKKSNYGSEWGRAGEAFGGVGIGHVRPPNKGGHSNDPADDVILEYDVGLAGAGPIEVFLTQGKSFPVVLMTCNRKNLLDRTIKSLRDVRGIDMGSVMVMQDGSDEKVEALVKREGLYLTQNLETPSLRGGPKPGMDGATRIAMHYKFALDHAFNRAQEAPGVIVVEDDLLFSPDFLEYFEANAPILERDPSTFILSAWNDNGYQGRVEDKAELQRTLHFPGLGWLLPRQLYDELRPRWPREHWDHWLRDQKQHKGRESVFPEVPRTYHNGAKGTFMTQAMHDKLFKNIDYNKDAAFSWPKPTGRTVMRDDGPPPYARASKDNYERRVEARINSARHISNLDELPAHRSAEGKKEEEAQEVVFWYSLPQTEEVSSHRASKSRGPPFEPLADFFGIWHEYKRGEHEGMHSIRYGGGSHVMLINTAKSPYAALKPPGLIPATMDHLHGLEGEAVSKGRGMRAVPGQSSSLSCDQICEAEGLVCKETFFTLLNSCTLLKENFPCTECSESYGFDQPCYVELGAPATNFPGQCLTTSSPSQSECSASHELTRRLCPCVPAR